MNETDLRHIRAVIAVAERAREHGNPPFGALLVDDRDQVLLEDENTTMTDRDLTAHPELKVARDAARQFDPELLSRCTMYASTEPCGMCSVAIYNSGIGRVVFALSGERLRAARGNPPEALALSSRDVFACGGRKVEVRGPVLEAEGLAIHKL
ncbi:nucleoside deaminase [soil metagenome]